MLNEQRLFKQPEYVDKLVKDKSLAMTSLLLNVFGMIGLMRVGVETNSPKVMRLYWSNLEKGSTALDYIGKRNSDTTQSVKIAFDSGVISDIEAKKILSFFQKIKNGAIDDGDFSDVNVRKLLHGGYFLRNKPLAKMIPHITAFYNGGSLNDLTRFIVLDMANDSNVVGMTVELRIAIMEKNLQNSKFMLGVDMSHDTPLTLDNPYHPTNIAQKGFPLPASTPNPLGLEPFIQDNSEPEPDSRYGGNVSPPSMLSIGGNKPFSQSDLSQFTRSAAEPEPEPEPEPETDISLKYGGDVSPPPMLSIGGNKQPATPTLFAASGDSDKFAAIMNDPKVSVTRRIEARVNWAKLNNETPDDTFNWSMENTNVTNASIAKLYIRKYWGGDSKIVFTGSKGKREITNVSLPPAMMPASITAPAPPTFSASPFNKDSDSDKFAAIMNDPKVSVTRRIEARVNWAKLNNETPDDTFNWSMENTNVTNASIAKLYIRKYWGGDSKIVFTGSKGKREIKNATLPATPALNSPIKYTPTIANNPEINSPNNTKVESSKLAAIMNDPKAAVTRRIEARVNWAKLNNETPDETFVWSMENTNVTNASIAKLYIRKYWGGDSKIVFTGSKGKREIKNATVETMISPTTPLSQHDPISVQKVDDAVAILQEKYKKENDAVCELMVKKFDWKISTANEKITTISKLFPDVQASGGVFGITDLLVFVEVRNNFSRLAIGFEDKYSTPFTVDDTIETKASKTNAFVEKSIEEIRQQNYKKRNNQKTELTTPLVEPELTVIDDKTMPTTKRIQAKVEYAKKFNESPDEVVQWALDNTNVATRGQANNYVRKYWGDQSIKFTRAASSRPVKNSANGGALPPPVPVKVASQPVVISPIKAEVEIPLNVTATKVDLESDPDLELFSVQSEEKLAKILTMLPYKIVDEKFMKNLFYYYGDNYGSIYKMDSNKVLKALKLSNSSIKAIGEIATSNNFIKLLSDTPKTSMLHNMLFNVLLNAKTIETGDGYDVSLNSVLILNARFFENDKNKNDLYVKSTINLLKNNPSLINLPKVLLNWDRSGEYMYVIRKIIDECANSVNPELQKIAFYLSIIQKISLDAIPDDPNEFKGLYNYTLNKLYTLNKFSLDAANGEIRSKISTTREFDKLSSIVVKSLIDKIDKGEMIDFDEPCPAIVLTHDDSKKLYKKIEDNDVNFSPYIDMDMLSKVPSNIADLVNQKIAIKKRDSGYKISTADKEEMTKDVNTNLIEKYDWKLKASAEGDKLTKNYRFVLNNEPVSAELFVSSESANLVLSDGIEKRSYSEPFTDLDSASSKVVKILDFLKISVPSNVFLPEGRLLSSKTKVGKTDKGVEIKKEVYETEEPNRSLRTTRYVIYANNEFSGVTTKSEVANSMYDNLVFKHSSIGKSATDDAFDIKSAIKTAKELLKDESKGVTERDMISWLADNMELSIKDATKILILARQESAKEDIGEVDSDVYQTPSAETIADINDAIKKENAKAFAENNILANDTLALLAQKGWRMGAGLHEIKRLFTNTTNDKETEFSVVVNVNTQDKNYLEINYDGIDKNVFVKSDAKPIDFVNTLENFIRDQTSYVPSSEIKYAKQNLSNVIKQKTLTELKANYDWDVDKNSFKPVKKFENSRGEKFVYRLDASDSFVDLVKVGTNVPHTLTFDKLDADDISVAVAANSKLTREDVVAKYNAEQIFKFTKEKTKEEGLHPIGEMVKSKKDKTYAGKDIEYRTYITKEKLNSNRLTYWEFLLQDKVIFVVTNDDEKHYTDVWQSMKEGVVSFQPPKKKAGFNADYGVSVEESPIAGESFFDPFAPKSKEDVKKAALNRIVGNLKKK